MKAIVQREYGPPEVLRFEDVAEPTVGDRDILVRVRAADVNAGDHVLLRGLPYLVRLMGFGLRRPKRPVPGQYVAGTVTAVGRHVERLRVGDEVFGTCRGAYAELVCAPEDAFARKPGNLTFEQAAAVPHGGFAALQALRDAGRLRRGQRVLIIGASGAVGTMAVQIGLAMGAEVTGVCSTRKLDLVRGLGADEVLDYTKDDFAADGARFDLILDMVHDRPDSDYRRALVPGGRTVMVGAGRGRWLGGMHRVLGAMITSLFSSKKFVGFLATPNLADLVALGELIEAGKVTPPVDRAFPLAATADAFRRHESRDALGMLVVTP